MMKHHLRTSPRRGSKRAFPLLTTLGFVFLWVMAYFLINPFSDETDRLKSEPYGEPRIRVSNVEWAVEESSSPLTTSVDLTSGSSNNGGGAESSKVTEEAVKRAVEEAKTFEFEDLDEADIYFGEFQEEEEEESTTKAKSKAAASARDKEMLGENVVGAPKATTTTTGSKELSYSDVVEERWFDLEDDQEKNQDAILDYKGDNLGDRYSQEEVHESIPRVLHFTWKTDQLDELPELFRKIQLKWRMLNPDWEIRIWTDEECEQMVKDYYPEYYFFYSDFEVTAERSDIWRYLVLDKFGGYYADMDIEPLQPLDELVKLVKDPDCVLGLEPEVHAILLYNKYHVIGNAFLGSRPGHPLWKWLIPQSIKRYYADRNPKDEKDATKITGPIAVDNVIQRNPEITRSCVLLKPDVTAPAYDITQKPYERCQPILEKQELKYGSEENPYVRICEEIDAVGEENKDYPPESFMVHHWAHTWQAKPDDTTKTDDAADDADVDDGENENPAGEAKPKLKLKLEEDGPGSEDGVSQSKEPKIFAQSNIGKEVIL
jgi:mannosyltransferase OCH1-like enzyme